MTNIKQEDVMNRIGIIGAMDEEVDILVELMDIKETIEKAK